MLGVDLLLGVTVGLGLLGGLEYALHRRKLASIPIRVHVNGTRGKSSVTRLIAAALREAGVVTCAKTTGTLARMILPDGRELPIFRPAGANIIEQRRAVAFAASHRAEALVVECMALDPRLQALCELRLLRATHGVITNARPDHLDVMGPRPLDVARALAGTTPVRGKLYTAEQAHLPVLRAAAQDRKTKLIAIDDDQAEACAGEVAARFSYTEHPENIALALRVCEDLGVEREVALRGMVKARPDPGALQQYRLDFFGRRITFVNAFAANDPVSSEQIWKMALAEHPQMKRRIAVVNCRADRPDRSVQLGRTLPTWEGADRVVLMGSATHLFADAALAGGVDEAHLLNAESMSTDEVFEQILSWVGDSALVVGLCNAGGQGLDLVRYFRNRAAPEDA
ncbi:MAG: poly-gamma-glutamate synthase PgsB [Deltaproteobacteria bacterium]|jgi:poly-gamma-glutamate synthase PgsB/CapB|nr:poly-gamma-glutamate synthase PgsB [Deltaproteobacteria bacterium]MBW2530508.1 poly-gamma-glutamate synthase PgsB [Deltaproteobacteria bacterium]